VSCSPFVTRDVMFVHHCAFVTSRSPTTGLPRCFTTSAIGHNLNSEWKPHSFTTVRLCYLLLCYRITALSSYGATVLLHIEYLRTQQTSKSKSRSFGTALLEANHEPAPSSMNMKGVSRWRWTHEIKQNTKQRKSRKMSLEIVHSF